MTRKVAIIGGGPAGLHASLKGAEYGLDITLFEKRKIGQGIKCAEGFIDSMKMLGKPEAGVEFKVNSLVIEAKNEYNLDCSGINLWMIDRSHWQQALKHHALSKGVDIKENYPIKAKDLDDLSASYDFVIDCSGIPSVTSIAKGFSEEYRKSWAYAYQAKVSGDFHHKLGELRAGVTPNYFGYYWIFPKTESTANVGLGIFPQNKNYPNNTQSNLKGELAALLQRQDLKSCTIISTIGGVIPTQPVSKVVHDNILLAGDSGGFASPLHGGGIDLAMITAEKAIEAILAENPSVYLDKLDNSVQAKLDVEQRIVELWEQLGYEHLDRLLRVILKKDAISELSKLFKFKELLFNERNAISTFFEGFFYGNWNYRLK